MAFRGIEDEYVAFERVLPGFGGIYFNENGDLVAKVPTGTGASALDAVRSAFLSGGRFVHEDGRVPDVVLEQADDSMSTLIRWSDALHAAARAEHGVHFFDADERRNRVTLYVQEPEQVDRAYALAEGLGIPREAVIVGV